MKREPLGGLVPRGVEMKITLNDSFVEYEYELVNGNDYSIKDIIDIIEKFSKMIATEGEIVNRPTLIAVDLAAQVGEGGEFHIEYISKDVVRLTPQGN